MSLQTIEINGVQITFDKEKTKAHRTEYNTPCDCQGCRNYYKHVAQNRELVEFLAGFGIDYEHAEEVMSLDLGDDPDSWLFHEGYYAVFGRLEDDIKLDHEKLGVDITFTKAATGPFDRTAINTDRTEPYFWIIVEDTVPYILDEERELAISFLQKIGKSRFVRAIKSIFKKN